MEGVGSNGWVIWPSSLAPGGDNGNPKDAFVAAERQPFPDFGAQTLRLPSTTEGIESRILRLRTDFRFPPILTRIPCERHGAVLQPDG